MIRFPEAPAAEIDRMLYEATYASRLDGLFYGIGGTVLVVYDAVY